MMGRIGQDSTVRSTVKVLAQDSTTLSTVMAMWPCVLSIDLVLDVPLTSSPTASGSRADRVARAQRGPTGRPEPQAEGS